MTKEILSPLYKKDTTGGIRVWRLEIDHDAGAYRTHSGTIDGKMAESGWTQCTPKNVGRSNETTAVTQAEAEVAAEYVKKRERGYFDNPKDVDKVHFTKPMLAQDWAKQKSKPVQGFTQPKLDGIRCIARPDGLWSRTGKQIFGVPHIAEALAPLFEAEPGLILDGELYNHDLKDDFNEITSIVRKEKPSAAELETARDLIHYHVYDLIGAGSLGYSERYDKLCLTIDGLNAPGIHLVSTVEFTSTEVLDNCYGTWLQDGYEGQMVRLDEPYEEGKRSKTLLKRKEFLSAEFPVEAVEEGLGNWAGAAKKFRVTLPDNRVFGAGVRGKKSALEALLTGPKPDWATIRYFTPTPDGIPRFPVVTDWGFGTRTD